MLKKLKICCGCTNGSTNDSVFVPEGTSMVDNYQNNPIARTPSLPDENPNLNLSHVTQNPIYFSGQTAPPSGPRPYINSDNDSGLSNPLDV